MPYPAAAAAPRAALRPAVSACSLLAAPYPGPARYCSPRYTMAYNSRNEGSNALDDVASNIWQDPPVAAPRGEVLAVAAQQAVPPQPDALEAPGDHLIRR